MPVPYIKKVARQTGKSVSSLEAKWNRAKKQAAEEGKAKNWGYVTSIFKNMAGVSESACAKFLRLVEFDQNINAQTFAKVNSVIQHDGLNDVFMVRLNNGTPEMSIRLQVPLIKRPGLRSIATMMLGMAVNAGNPDDYIRTDAKTCSCNLTVKLDHLDITTIQRILAELRALRHQ